MAHSSTLSQRGQSAINQPIRADLDLFYEAMNDQYDAVDNPTGKFLLCIAENLHNSDRMNAKLQEIAAGPIPEWVPSYTAILGAPPLREAAVEFLEYALNFQGLNPDNLGAAAGAVAIIELCALFLGDPGDYVVIPGPAYMAYTPDIENKAQLQRYNLHVPDAGGEAALDSTYRLTTADLDAAYTKLGTKFKVLLLTQPNNPTGQVFTARQLEDFADWCVAHQVHLIVNEIYLFSRFDQNHPALESLFPEPVSFTSFLPILHRRDSPYLHWWYAISKDFGLSGLRLGFAYTHNENLLKAWSNYGAPSMASNHTQWLLSEIFRDQEWTSDFLSRSQQSLTESYAIVIEALDDGIPYSAAVGSPFVWFDLSAYLRADTEAAEQDLWIRIYEETGILLTAPNGMGSPERGWFRLVHSCVAPGELRVAMERLKGWLRP
ncbi:MAG: aminotransferase class I/II-fold pyridoxal phosphate-dependent enzyme [Bacteroidota bacterium]